jgi:branched-subunit amino acid ABC-type transport system permease component
MLIILAGYGVLFALCGAAVRIQFTVFRGFDFICAVAVLLSAEAFIWCTRLGTGTETISFSLALLSALVTASFITAVWNMVVDRAFFHRKELGGGLLILSLGISTGITGLIVLLRGPGLRQSAITMSGILGNPAMLVILLGGPVLITIILWTTNRAGLALNLWAQDSAFATEIGIDRRRLAPVSGLLGGACLGIVGSYFAIAGGSSPEIGLPAFLYGAASALLLPGTTIGQSVLGGLILGPLFVALQLIVAPAVSNSILFALALGLLLYRGTSRNAQQLR